MGRTAMTTYTLFAEDPAPTVKKEAAGESSFFMNPMFIMAMLGLFFVVVMLPASRRKKREEAAMIASIKPGSKIVTASGIVGNIVTMKDGEDEVTIKSADTKLRVLRTSIARVIGAEETPAAAADAK